MSSAAVPDQFIVGGTSLGFRRGVSSWEVTPDRILCVGEATSESASRAEDWLICLVTDVQGAWVEASLYSHGRNDALQWLSLALSSSMEVKLANAPPFRSRVMWPPELRERPLFEFQVSPLRRVFGRSLRRLGWPSRGGIQTIHPRVLSALWRTRRLKTSQLD